MNPYTRRARAYLAIQTLGEHLPGIVAALRPIADGEDAEITDAEWRAFMAGSTSAKVLAYRYVAGQIASGRITVVRPGADGVHLRHAGGSQ